MKMTSSAVSDDVNIVLPANIHFYKDTKKNQCLGIYMILLSGIEHTDVKASVVRGGRQVKVTCLLPERFFDAEGLVLPYNDDKGHLLYGPRDTKTISIGNTIDVFKSGGGRVKSVFRIELPFQVEEQFVDRPFHPGFDLLCDNGLLYLHLEMMGQRSSRALVRKTSTFRDMATNKNKRQRSNP